MSRISNIRIKNFKTFNDLDVKSLNKRINFIYGKNGVGKTSLLEAVYLLLCYSYPRPDNISYNLQILLHYQFYLGNPFALVMPPFNDLWNTIFKNSEEKIEVAVDLEDGSQLSLLISRGFNRDGNQEIVLKWDYTEKGSKKLQTQQCSIIDNVNLINNVNLIRNPIGNILQPKKIISKKLNFFYMPSMFLSNSSGVNIIYSDVINSGKKKELVDKLRIVEQDVEDIELVSTGLQTVMVKRKNAFMPISQMGGGFLRIFYVMGVSITRENGIILIDEIENGLHWSVQKKIFEYILRLSKDLNIQYFIATHSLEFVREAFKTLKNVDDIDSISATRINKKDNDKIYPSLISGQDLKEMLEEEMEFR